MGQMTLSGRLGHCSGCEDNFYNGHNALGIKECWHLRTFKLVKRCKIHVDQCPPWTQEPITVPDCYRQKRYVFWNPKNCGARYRS